jgi:DNA-binding CsgD family transcriptional regulator/tetratricopeptide (TPR) repeat protein
VRDRHRHFYIEFLKDIWKTTTTGNDADLFANTPREIDNVWEAWHRVVETGAFEGIGWSIFALAYFLFEQGLFQNVRIELGRASERLRAQPPGEIRDRVLARVLIHLGWSCFMTSEVSRGSQLLEESLSILRRLDALDDGDGMVALVFAGWVLHRQGDDSRAGPHFEQAMAVATGLPSPFLRLICLLNVGRYYLDRGELVEAKRLFSESHTIGLEGGFITGLCYLALFLGLVSTALGQLDEAGMYFHEILSLYGPVRGHGVVVILLGVAGLQARLQRVEQAVELLTILVHHPLIDTDTQARGQDMLDQLQPALPSETLARLQRSAEQHLQEINLLEEPPLDLSPRLIAQLSEMLEPEDAAASPPADFPPFTAREWDVLRLLATGMSNGDIAERLVVNEGTVKTHTHHIFDKLGVRSRTQAILLARDLKLI